MLNNIINKNINKSINKNTDKNINNQRYHECGNKLYKRYDKKFILTAIFGIMLMAMIPSALASSPEASHEYAVAFLWIAVILIAAKLSSLVEKWGQPPVLGELVIGIILGNLALIGIHVLEPLGNNNIISFLAELGVVILLFQIGLESNIVEMGKVGIRAFLVAVVGVIAPFLLGTFIVGPWLMPGLAFNTYLFVGAALTATSVGITARVFKDLGKLNIREAKIVLGAAVIDDVLGLIILSVVSAIAIAGSVGLGEIGQILLKAIIFLVSSVLGGYLLAPHLGKFFSKIHNGHGMKFTLAICFGLIFAYLANGIGLAAIVGAFAAGLVLDPMHFKYYSKPKIVDDLNRQFKDSEDQKHINEVIKKHSDKHIEDIIEPIGHFLVPIFFVITGFVVDLSTLFDLKVLLVALALTVAAVIGKIFAGIIAGKCNKWIVGWGMVPRGEVGLIFATIGRSIGVVSDTIFSVIIVTVILTTLIPPLILNYLVKKQEKQEENAA